MTRPDDMVLADPRTLDTLVAELQAARAVVVAARDLLDEVTVDWHEPRQLQQALDAYDEAVTP